MGGDNGKTFGVKVTPDIPTEHSKTHLSHFSIRPHEPLHSSGDGEMLGFGKSHSQIDR
jgi:hypothetical protein